MKKNETKKVQESKKAKAVKVEAPVVEVKKVPFVRMTTQEIAALIIPGQPIPEDLIPKLTPGQKRYWSTQRMEREAKAAAQPRTEKAPKSRKDKPYKKS